MSVPTDLTDHELRAWQALLHAHHKIVNILDRELQDEHGLPFGAYDVLLRLARAADRELRMSELADRVMISPSGLTRMVDRLERDGLVERKRVSEDARVMMAKLTDRGREVLRRAAKTHVRGIREHFTKHLSEAQLRQVAQALEAITGPHKPH